MARKKKQSLSQTVVSVGASGLPAPVRSFLSNRLVSLGILLIAPVLFFFGILSVEWVDGWPKLHFNRQKAEAVAKQAAEKIEDINGKDSKSAEIARNALKVIGNLEGESNKSNSNAGNGLNLRFAENITQTAGSWFQPNPNPPPPAQGQSQFGNLTISGLLQPHGQQ